MSLFVSHTIKQFQRFAVVGVANTTIGYSVFFLLFHFVHLYYILSAVLGYVSGLLFGFTFSRRWAFRSSDVRRGRQLLRFGSVYLTSLALSMLFLKFLVAMLRFDPRIANVFAIGLSTMTNFLGCKYVVFRQRQI